MSKQSRSDQPIFQEGEVVQTPEGNLGVIFGIYPTFELDLVDYYVKVNDEIEIHRADTLKRITV